jgi:hypothetical protein
MPAWMTPFGQADRVAVIVHPPADTILVYSGSDNLTGMQQQHKIKVLILDARSRAACQPVPTSLDQAGLLNIRHNAKKQQEIQ